VDQWTILLGNVPIFKPAIGGNASTKCNYMKVVNKKKRESYLSGMKYANGFAPNSNDLLCEKLRKFALHAAYVYVLAMSVCIKGTRTRTRQCNGVPSLLAASATIQQQRL
jgi:hypothetical protein